MTVSIPVSRRSVLVWGLVSVMNASPWLCSIHIWIAFWRSLARLARMMVAQIGQHHGLAQCSRLRIEALPLTSWIVGLPMGQPQRAGRMGLMNAVPVFLACCLASSMSHAAFRLRRFHCFCR